MHKSQKFLCFSLAFLVGVALASFFELGIFYLILALPAIFFLALIFKPRANLRIICFCLLFLILGILRFNISNPPDNPEYINFYNDKEEITFYGYINEEPDERVDHIKLKIKTQALEINKEYQEVKGNVLVKSGLFPKYSYGDYLRISCYLMAPGQIEDFAYDKYLARYNVYSTCYRPRIKVLDIGYGNLFYSKVLIIKQHLLEKINQIITEPQASFLAGILIGARKGIPDDLTEAFNRTGITHIIAISGFNITIIAVMILNLSIAIGISRKKSFWVSLIVIIFFVMICGMPASVVRAGIMGLLVLLSQNLGRSTRMSNVLMLVAFVMILINPKILIYDAGFQLSFLATIGLVYLNPKISERFKRLPSFLQIKESVLTTTSAIIFTTPLIIYQFGRFSILALPTNLLVLPVIPLSMALGFGALIFGLIWLPLGQAFAWLVWLILSYVIKITLFFSEFSFASLDLPTIPWQVMTAMYLFLFWWLWLRKGVDN